MKKNHPSTAIVKTPMAKKQQRFFALLLLVALMLPFGNILLAQTPGGVASPKMWVKADAGFVYENGGSGLLRDRTSNDNNGSLKNVALTGATNSAFNFHGANDYIDIPVNNAFHAGISGYTIEAWIKSRDVNGCIVGRGSVYNTNQNNITYLDGAARLANVRWNNDVSSDVFKL